MIYDAKVIENKKIAEEIYWMKLDAGKKFKAEPGQFINIRVADSFQPLLRRPFSIFYAEKGKVEIVYKVIGKGTAILANKKKGDKVNFIGPLGKSYLEFGILNLESGKKIQSKIQNPKPRIILVGGGTGIASLHFLARELKKRNIKFELIQGAKNKQCVIMPNELKQIGCIFATDDGSFGKKGFVSDALKGMLEGNIIIYTCGPKQMFKAIKKVTEHKKNVKVLASFEEYMGCGIGACLSCVVEIDGEYIRVCKEGPVFDMDNIKL